MRDAHVERMDDAVARAAASMPLAPSMFAVSAIDGEYISAARE